MGGANKTPEIRIGIRHADELRNLLRTRDLPDTVTVVGFRGLTTYLGLAGRFDSLADMERVSLGALKLQEVELMAVDASIRSAEMAQVPERPMLYTVTIMPGARLWTATYGPFRTDRSDPSDGAVYMDRNGILAYKIWNTDVLRVETVEKVIPGEHWRPLQQGRLEGV